MQPWQRGILSIPAIIFYLFSHAERIIGLHFMQSELHGKIKEFETLMDIKYLKC